MRWLLAAMPAGSRTKSIDVRRWWRELLSIEPGRRRHLAYATESEAYTRTREADGVGLNDAA